MSWCCPGPLPMSPISEPAANGRHAWMCLLYKGDKSSCAVIRQSLTRVSGEEWKRRREKHLSLWLKKKKIPVIININPKDLNQPTPLYDPISIQVLSLLVRLDDKVLPRQAADFGTSRSAVHFFGRETIGQIFSNNSCLPLKAQRAPALILRPFISSFHWKCWTNSVALPSN